MSITQQIRTIEEMERLYYTRKGFAALQELGEINHAFIQKSDAPVASTTTGVYNAVYGVEAWTQLNQEANTFGALPKSVHRKSGWRVITARAGTQTSAGVSETGAIPDSVKPTFAEVSTKPKLVAEVFENTEIQEFLAQSDDDAYGAMDQLRRYMGSQHRETVNVHLNVQNGTLASNNLESVDRVASSNDEVSNGQENDQSTAYTSGDLDIYGQDRDDGASWADAYVNHNDTSGVRTLKESHLHALYQNTLANGANRTGQWFQTGYDTWSTINQLFETQVRYNLLGETEVRPGVNGIQPAGDQGTGLTVSTLYGRPLIESKDTVSETGGISRLYLFDTSNPEGFQLPRLSFRTAKPTQYFEAGMNTGDPFVIDKFGTKGMYRTMGELICTFFKVQGKLRDLKA